MPTNIGALPRTCDALRARVQRNNCYGDAAVSRIETTSDVLAYIERDEDLSKLMRAVEARLDDDPGHDSSHCVRVAFWTVRLGAGESCPRIAIAAALLHDVVNVPKNSPKRNRASELSAEVARDLLPRHGFDPAQVTEICRAIIDHSFSRGAVPTTPLGRALQDADRLEALGALGLFRTISTGTRMGAVYFHATDPWAENRELADTAYTVDHFFRKLLRLPDTLLTEAGRAEAHRRAEFLRAFLAQLGEELGRPYARDGRGS